MADSRFFACSGPFTLAQLAELSGTAVANTAHAERSIEDVAPLSEATASQLSFLDNPKYKHEFSETSAGACVVAEKHASLAPDNTALLISAEPYRAYAKIAAAFYPSQSKGEVSPRAYVSETAQIGQNTVIEAGAYIGDGVQIGDDCFIGANAVITYALLGDRVRIHANVNIGQDGFGYAMGAGGHLKVPQLGRVLIGNDVEIGAGSCVDRGAGPDTVIGEGTKIDNLVQIGHNVKIGKHVVIVSQVGISGSTTIGDYAVIGGQAGIAGHLEIGAGAQMAARSGVINNLEAGKTYGGTPAVAIRDWHRQTAALNRLVEQKRVKKES